ncbi:SLATT domain-containing protein [Paracidovorax avenae]|uniref:SLATT domain-containing protein n=1 Tax=Paracidovorax avenae TaxID=80867 RepID=UPI00126010B5|nr:SLATT domain-containing protein [Paracidovorax avenae]
MQEFLGMLQTKAWRTAGARYNAARRLNMREAMSMWSLTLLSALSIAVAFFQKVYSPQSGTPLDNYLTVAAMTLGVFLLILSLLEWGAKYGARAEALHRNAELLTAFHLKVAFTIKHAEYATTITPCVVDKLRIEYEEIKDRCGTNHHPRDDALFRAYHRNSPEFTSNGKPRIIWIESQWIKIIWILSEAWIFIAIWLLVAIAVSFLPDFSH